MGTKCGYCGELVLKKLSASVLGCLTYMNMCVNHLFGCSVSHVLLFPEGALLRDPGSVNSTDCRAGLVRFWAA